LTNCVPETENPVESKSTPKPPTGKSRAIVMSDEVIGVSPPPDETTLNEKSLTVKPPIVQPVPPKAM
jgi:hypothetical protein